MPSPPQIHDLEAWEEYYRGLERTIPTGIEKSTGAHPFGAGLLNFRCLRSTRFMGTRRNATRSSVEFHGISIRIHPLFLPREIRGEVEWAKWSGEREPLRTLKKLINSISENRLIGLSWRLKTGLWRLMKSIVEPVCRNVLKNRRRNDSVEVWIEWFFLKFKDFFFFFFRNVEFNSRTFETYPQKFQLLADARFMMASCRVTTVDEYSVQKTWKNSSYNFHRSFSILWYHRFYGKFTKTSAFSKISNTSCILIFTSMRLFLSR